MNSPLPPALRVASAIVLVASALPFIAAPASGGENHSPTNLVNATTQRPAARNNPIVTRPKINEVGYLPQRSKCFSITRTESGPHRGDSFRVVTEAGIPVFSGSFSNGPVDDPATRESVFVGDFSELRAPGRYKIEVNGLDSDPFTIGAAVYRPLYNDALRCFYLLRCGVGIDDAQTGIRHSPCHLKDAPPKAGGAASDLTGGWHNADDYGKWVLEEAVSCSWMMWLYELKTRDFATLKINIADSTHHISDLLNEVRWGLSWMLKMQQPDGSVLHKVDAEEHFCPTTPPEKNPFPRFSQPPGSIDAADFVGAMCQASRVFRSPDPPFADTCLRAAKRAWAWLEQHPHLVYTDPDYVDSDPSEEELWALGEMARTTGDRELEERFAHETAPGELQAVSWWHPQLFGYMAMAFGKETRLEQRHVIRRKLGALCDDFWWREPMPTRMASAQHSRNIIGNPTRPSSARPMPSSLRMP